MEKINSSKLVKSNLYSHAVVSGKNIYISGQLPIHQGKIIDDIEEAAQICIENAKIILSEKNLGLDSIVKVTVILKNFSDIERFNKVYGDYFGNFLPARTTFVAIPPKGAVLEMEFIAEI